MFQFYSNIYVSSISTYRVLRRNPWNPIQPYLTCTLTSCVPNPQNPVLVVYMTNQIFARWGTTIYQLKFKLRGLDHPLDR
jgi:carbamoylphosphate synthase small subunit